MPTRPLADLLAAVAATPTTTRIVVNPHIELGLTPAEWLAHASLAGTVKPSRLTTMTRLNTVVAVCYQGRWRVSWCLEHALSDALGEGALV